MLRAAVRSIVLALLVGTRVVGSFPPNCEVHKAISETEAAQERWRPAIPRRAKFGDKWLPSDNAEVTRYYDAGVKECQAFLNDAAAKAKHLDQPWPIPHKKMEKQSGSFICRGNSMLFGLTGVLAWRFGPSLSECSTYQHCWFGVLTCGEPKESLRNLTINQVTKHVQKATPAYLGTKSGLLRTLYFFARIVGEEMLTPDVRVVVLPNRNSVDVQIFKFTLTLPSSRTRLEIRLAEFYPSSLYNWTQAQTNAHGARYLLSIYLGGTEERCPPFMRCTVQPTVPECDAASLLLNSNDSAFAVRSSSSRSPGCGPPVDKFPLCLRTTSRPGRWLNAENLCNASRHSPATPEPALKVMFAGDPCEMRRARLLYDSFQGVTEEEGLSSWIFAPYSCALKYYTLPQLKSCFDAKGIKHIHFQGDSMTRDLYAAALRLMGIPGVKENELKLQTNAKKGSRTGSAVSLFSNNHSKSDDVLVSEGYFWAPDELKGLWPMLRDDAPRGPPQVIVANYALAHRGEHPRDLDESYQTNAGNVWESEFPFQNKSGPQWRLYQTARDPRGLKAAGFPRNAEGFRLRSKALELAHARHSFAALDTFTMLESRFDALAHPERDGWHHYGSSRMVEAMLLFNFVCND